MTPDRLGRNNSVKWCSIINRTIESLYEELVREGVIKKHPKVRLSDYIGDFRFDDTFHYHMTIMWHNISYLATTLRQMPRDPNSKDKNPEKIEPMPSLSDVRRLITEHCILSLGMYLRMDNKY